MLYNFHAFTLKSQKLENQIRSDIQIMHPFPIKKASNGKLILPRGPIFTGKALWDTGATASVISSQIVKELGLSPTGKVDIQTANGKNNTYTYIVNIGLPNGVLIIGNQVSECEHLKNMDVIIGMDIIKKGDFSITNYNKKTCVSYRYPSIKTIDYVEEAKQMKSQKEQKKKIVKVGRNDPCPCGKKKDNGEPVKYKNCCLKTGDNLE